MKAAILLINALRDPASTTGLRNKDWMALITAARAEQLIASLAFRLEHHKIPEPVARIFEDARASAQQWRRSALWEAEMVRRALEPLTIPVVLMKGTAYIAAGLDAGIGRSIGDTDIMVARDDLAKTETALLGAGWEWVKPDPYDDQYYRIWMHELPPMIHRDRDRMLDVHHTILPLTARPKPDAAAMLADTIVLQNGLRIFAPEDMVLHAVAHLFADGDMAGGLRNLWDIDRMLRQFSERNGFWDGLISRANRHGLHRALARALRLTAQIYGTPVDGVLAGRARWSDQFFYRRLMVRNGWGQETRTILRLGFYIRSHLLRMPPMMLARHLWIKWRSKAESIPPINRA